MKTVPIFIFVFIFSIMLISASISSNSMNAFELASTAQANYDDREYDPAIAAAKKALSDPGIPNSARDQALNVLVWSYFQKKEYRQALTEFKKIIVNYPDCRYHGSAMMMLAQCYQTTGNILTAMQTYEKVLSLYPDPNEYRTITAKKELASLYLSIKTSNPGLFKTISANTSLIAVIPDYLFTTGQILIEKRQDYVAAEQYFREIANQFPNYNQVDITLWKLGVCLKEQRKYYAAITVYRQVVEKFPTSRYRYHAEYGMFDAIQNVGSPEETIEAAKKLLNSPIQNYRKTGVQAISGLYASLGAGDAAIKFLKEQQEKDPKCMTNEEYQEQMKIISDIAGIPYSVPKPVKAFPSAAAELDAFIATHKNIDDLFFKIDQLEVFKQLHKNYKNPDPIVLEEILSLLATYPNSLVRERCASALMFSAHNPMVMKGLINALNTEKDINVRMHIAETLGNAKVAEAVPGITKCIQAFSRQTEFHMDCLNYRGSIIQSLGKCGSTATNSIIELSKDDRIWRGYARDLIIALKNTGDKRTLSVLSTWMHNPNSDIHLTAASAAIPLSSDSPEMKELIFTTLVELTNDSSSYVREQAVKMLGILGDTRAIPYLEKLLTDRAEITYERTEGEINWKERHLPVREAAGQALVQLGYYNKKAQP